MTDVELEQAQSDLKNVQDLVENRNEEEKIIQEWQKKYQEDFG